MSSSDDKITIILRQNSVLKTSPVKVKKIEWNHMQGVEIAIDEGKQWSNVRITWWYNIKKKQYIISKYLKELGSDLNEDDSATIQTELYK